MPAAQSSLSFQRDIAPLFTKQDITRMKEIGLDLSDYADVKDRAEQILDRLRDAKSPMPPRDSGGPWPQERIATFARWIAEGKKP